MNKITMISKLFLAQFVIVIIASLWTSSVAHAGFIDLATISDKNGSLKNSLTYALSYLNPQDETGSDTIDTPNTLSNGLVQNTSLIQTTSPSKKLVSPKNTVTKTYTVTITAYSSTVAETDNDPFTMASGNQVYDGAVAANFLPFRTKIQVPQLFGQKIFKIEDRMNRRYNPEISGEYRIDIWFPTAQAAANFGIRHNIAMAVIE